MGKRQLQRQIKALEKKYQQLSNIQTDDEKTRDGLMDNRIRTLHEMVGLRKRLIS